MKALPLKIAVRYLIAKKSHTAVSIISIISVVAVAVTATAMVCVLSVFNGFSRIVNEKLSLLDPDIRITSVAGKVVANADSLLQVVRAVEGVEMAAVTITDNALAVYGGRQTAVTLKGVSDEYGSMTDIASTVKSDGRYLLEMNGSELAILSVGTAVTLQAHPSFYTPLDIYVPKRTGAVNIANPASAFRKSEFFVSGVFEVEQAEYDMNYIIVPLAAARRLYSYDTEATAIEVKLAAGHAESQVMRALSQALGRDYRVENRLMQHSHSLHMIEIEKWITFLLLGFILIIASFNIISTLAVLIIEKDESIRTLHFLGADNALISRVFVIQGWLISLSGALAGIIAGTVLCLLQQHFGLLKMSSEAGNLIVDVYPVELQPVDLLAVFGIVAIVGLLTSVATAFAMRRYLRSRC